MLMNHNKIFVAENSIEKHTPSLLPSPLIWSIFLALLVYGEKADNTFLLFQTKCFLLKYLLLLLLSSESILDSFLLFRIENIPGLPHFPQTFGFLNV